MRSARNRSSLAESRKRPVNLTLNEDLVQEVRSLTGNLSEVVESLLQEYLERERRNQLAKAQAITETVRIWNRFTEDRESIADEYSTL